MAGAWYTSHLHSFDFVIGEETHKEKLALNMAGFESETFQMESQPVPLDPQVLNTLCPLQCVFCATKQPCLEDKRRKAVWIQTHGVALQPFTLSTSQIIIST
jgi:hypothetical protein